MTDDLRKAIQSLERRRGDHLMQVQLIEHTIMNLQAIMGNETTSEPAAVERSSVSLARERPSVYRAAVDILNEEDREWTIEDLRTEIERREMSIEVTDLQNSLFSALSRASRKGELVRTGTGRYRAAKYEPSVVMESETSMTIGHIERGPDKAVADALHRISESEAASG
jgi:hypothetical protein